jgi:hypothetical protein
MLFFETYFALSLCKFEWNKCQKIEYRKIVADIGIGRCRPNYFSSDHNKERVYKESLIVSTTTM